MGEDIGALCWWTNTASLVVIASARNGTLVIRRGIWCVPWCHREPDEERMWDAWPSKLVGTSQSKRKPAGCLMWPTVIVNCSIEQMAMPINLGRGCPHLQLARKER